MPGGITSMARISPKLMTWAVDLTHLHLLLVSRLSSDRPAPQQPTSQAQSPAGGGQTGSPPTAVPSPRPDPPVVPFSGARSRQGQKQLALEGARLKQGSSLPKELQISLPVHIAGFSFGVLKTQLMFPEPRLFPAHPPSAQAYRALKRSSLTPPCESHPTHPPSAQPAG